MKLDLKISFTILIMLALIAYVGFNIQLKLKRSAGELTDSQKLGMSRRLELEGKALFRAGKFDEAMKKFDEANDPKFYLYPGHSNGYAGAYIREIYFTRGEYEKALEGLNQSLELGYIKKMLKVENEMGAHHLVEEKREYESLIQMRESASSEPIYKYIEHLKADYKQYIPPVAYQFGIGTTIITTILRLYDTIADYDAGIAYVNEMMAFFEKQDVEKYGQYKPGKVDQEYLKVREGFEQDKAEGRKSCINAKPGEACVGRATKALIQSDYFPW
jgi:tetratricopeptide (TPR) repeat protein